MSYFTEDKSEDAVLNRLSDDVEPRFREIVTSFINHLHGFVKEVEPTMEEWGKAIEFLTATGQISTLRGKRSLRRCRISRITAPEGEVTTPMICGR